MRAFRLHRLHSASCRLSQHSPDRRAQQRFKTPEEAADALVAALRAGDAQAIAKRARPGDRRHRFRPAIPCRTPTRGRNSWRPTTRAPSRHRERQAGGPGGGQADWPLPIPIVEKDGEWQFDTAAGREEILAPAHRPQRVCRIQACLAYVDAQNEYADSDAGQRRPVYAQRIISSPGKKDGLYWPAARASGQPARRGGGGGDPAGLPRRRRPRAVHGYYYKILTRQGPTAPGGAPDYIVAAR